MDWNLNSSGLLNKHPMITILNIQINSSSDILQSNKIFLFYFQKFELKFEF